MAFFPPTNQPRAGATARGLASPQHATPALALLPFATIAVLLILLLNLLRLGAALLPPTTPTQPPLTTSLAAVSNTQHPVGTPANPPLKVALPVQPTNLQFGNPQAPHTLTILTDPACVPCQLRLATWLRPLPPDALHIVVKYLPLNPANQTAGLLLELARRHNLAPAYWHSLGQAAAGTSALTLTDDRLFELLEQQGLPLAPLQDELQKTSASLVAALTPDLTAAQTAGLTTPPILLLDGTVIDGRRLSQPADALFAP